MNFQRHPFDRLIMRIIFKNGRSCDRHELSKSFTIIAVSLFARLPPRALLAASPLARDSCSATFPRGFSSKRETARSPPFRRPLLAGEESSTSQLQVRVRIQLLFLFFSLLLGLLRLIIVILVMVCK